MHASSSLMSDLCEVVELRGNVTREWWARGCEKVGIDTGFSLAQGPRVGRLPRGVLISHEEDGGFRHPDFWLKSRSISPWKPPVCGGWQYRAIEKVMDLHVGCRLWSQ